MKNKIPYRVTYHRRYVNRKIISVSNNRTKFSSASSVAQKQSVTRITRFSKRIYVITLFRCYEYYAFIFYVYEHRIPINSTIYIYISRYALLLSHTHLQERMTIRFILLLFLWQVETEKRRASVTTKHSRPLPRIVSKRYERRMKEYQWTRRRCRRSCCR